jgi:curved DNA-binding protein CbpA
MREINEAHHVLSDQSRRKSYDEARQVHATARQTKTRASDVSSAAKALEAIEKEMRAALLEARDTSNRLVDFLLNVVLVGLMKTLCVIMAAMIIYLLFR